MQWRVIATHITAATDVILMAKFASLSLGDGVGDVGVAGVGGVASELGSTHQSM